MQEPRRAEWRNELVGWLIRWGDLESAHQQALIGVQLDPDHPGLQNTMKMAVEASRPGPRPGGVPPEANICA